MSQKKNQSNLIYDYLIEAYLDVAVFQYKAGGLPQSNGGQLPDAQSIQSGSPVQRFCNGGFF